MTPGSLRPFQKLQLVQEALSWVLFVGELESGDVLKPAGVRRLEPYLTVMALWHIEEACLQAEKYEFRELTSGEVGRFRSAWADAELLTLRGVYQHYAEKVAVGPGGPRNRNSFGPPLGEMPVGGIVEPFWAMSSSHGPDFVGVRSVTVLGRTYDVGTVARVAVILEEPLRRVLRTLP